MNNKFETYLHEGSLRGLSSIPKSDIHSHAGLGGKVDYIGILLYSFDY